jgi:cytochrome c-type biogenesis protein CcmF
MIVHIGVVLIAVGFAASHSFAKQTELSLRPGVVTAYDGHTFEFLGMRTVTTSVRSAVEARVRVDGGQVYAPAISDYAFAGEQVGTPSVRSRLTEDVYLTLAATPAKAGAPVLIGVIVEPLVMWIWIGGGIMLGGAVLSAWPGRRRRRPTDPVSAMVGDKSLEESAEPVRQPAGVAQVVKA